MSLISFLVNRLFTRADRKRDRGLQTPADIERRDDLSYGPHGKWNLLDVYLPRGTTHPLPVIINVHGGGWVYGTKEVYQFYCMSLAQRGFAVLNLNYRLAPASRFPAPLEDLNRAVHWMHTRAEEFPFDLRRVFLVGDSAGANSAALYASLCTNPEYAARFAFQPPSGFRPTAVALNCGVYDPTQKGEGMISALSLLYRDYLGKGYTHADLQQINACAWVNADFPPTFLMTAEYDMARPQSPFMLARLEECGIRHIYKVYGEGNKEVQHVFHCNMRLPEARQCNDDECVFFQRVTVTD